MYIYLVQMRGKFSDGHTDEWKPVHAFHTKREAERSLEAAKEDDEENPMSVKWEYRIDKTYLY